MSGGKSGAAEKEKHHRERRKVDKERDAGEESEEGGAASPAAGEGDKEGDGKGLIEPIIHRDKDDQPREADEP